MNGVGKGAYLADEVILQNADELLAIKIARWERDDIYADSLREAVWELISEIWPVDTPVDAASYVEAVEQDINKIDHDLLERLVAALIAHAGVRTSGYGANGPAANLVSNWLKLRIIEMRSDKLMSHHASRLKQKHADFLLHVLDHGYLQAAPAPLQQGAVH